MEDEIIGHYELGARVDGTITTLVVRLHSDHKFEMFSVIGWPENTGIKAKELGQWKIVDDEIVANVGSKDIYFQLGFDNKIGHLKTVIDGRTVLDNLEIGHIPAYEKIDLDSLSDEEKANHWNRHFNS